MLDPRELLDELGLDELERLLMLLLDLFDDDPDELETLEWAEELSPSRTRCSSGGTRILPEPWGCSAAVSRAGLDWSRFWR